MVEIFVKLYSVKVMIVCECVFNCFFILISWMKVINLFIIILLLISEFVVIVLCYGILIS